MRTVFRVINEDISTQDYKDIIDFCDTLGEALQCSVDNYFFNTSIEKWVNYEWKLVAVNGELVA